MLSEKIESHEIGPMKVGITTQNGLVYGYSITWNGAVLQTEHKFPTEQQALKAAKKWCRAKACKILVDSRLKKPQ